MVDVEGLEKLLEKKIYQIEKLTNKRVKLNFQEKFNEKLMESETVQCKAEVRWRHYECISRSFHLGVRHYRYMGFGKRCAARWNYVFVTEKS